MMGMFVFISAQRTTFGSILTTKYVLSAEFLMKKMNVLFVQFGNKESAMIVLISAQQVTYLINKRGNAIVITTTNASKLMQIYSLILVKVDKRTSMKDVMVVNHLDYGPTLQQMVMSTFQKALDAANISMIRKFALLKEEKI